MTKKFPLAVALSAFAVACADPAGPTTRTLLSAPSHIIVTPTPAATSPVPFGSVELCKTSNVAGSFGFTTSTTAASGTRLDEGTPDVTITIGAGGGTGCKIVYSGSTLGNVGGADAVTIIENANAVTLTNIDVIQYLHPDPVYGAPGSAPRLNDSEDEGTRTAIAKINSDMARRVTFTNTQASTGNQGCTPGYWKQNQHADSWNAPYDPTDDFDTTFGVNLFNPDISLLDALNLGGGAGGKNQLARAAVAALLNAAEGFYPMTTAQVIAAVQAATPATYESVKNTLDANNNLGCPLN
jgi:hypothetical protein